MICYLSKATVFYLHIGSLKLFIHSPCHCPPPFTSTSQGTNARKVISKVNANFLLLFTVFRRKSINTRRMSQLDMESIFTKIIDEIFLLKETII